ncbi:HD family hydrolase [Pantoea sp. BAV 3049]|uniref:HD family hydrolase n=1 Tax=Pantoea sp. BAV 3049 TaxID=2654188 RepID=UPI00131C6F75|nr:HD family hydrolase [Pantoea sp. BAV 3049]
MSWITTLTGRHFNFCDITPESICIEDIAAALSNICRFTGHVPEFYSVAQHSVLVSDLVPPEFAFEALMHDAAEAYCNDIAAPLKQLLPDYRNVIQSVESAIAVKYGLPLEMSREVKHADLVMLATERREFGLDDGTPWPILHGIDPAPILINPLSPRQALVKFMQRYNELRAGELSNG